MAVFIWKGRTLAGEAQSGEIEVGRQDEALEILRKKRILVTSLKPKSGGVTMPKFGGSGVSTKDLAIFTRQFATMISAGLPLVQCLDILAKQASKPSFGRVIAETTRRSRRARRCPTRSASTRTCSTTCSATWSRPARPAACWTRS
jgi:type IV pilus assembly protein PilC